MSKIWIRGVALAGLGWMALADGAGAQNPPPGAPPQPAARAGQHDLGDNDLPGPIDSVQDLQDTAKMLFKLSDTNNDGQISQKEAIDVGNLLVGGFFFRADQNGDGAVSQDELRTARDSLLRQKPLLRVVLERERNAGAQAGQPGGTQRNPVRGLGALLDSNQDKQLQAAELRKAVETSVQGLYEAADTNRDGQMSPAEINAAMIGMARSAAQAAFQTADTDHNGSLSKAEFDQAIIAPANAIFNAVDANADGQISQQEAQQARRVLISQLRMLQVPEPANSPRNLVETGAAPDQAAPIPNFGAAPPPPARRSAPAPGTAPAPPR